MNNITVDGFRLIILLMRLKWNLISKFSRVKIHADDLIINYSTNHDAENVFQILRVKLRQPKRILS